MTRRQRVKRCQMNQRVLILNATDTPTARAAAATRAGNGATEVQVHGVDSVNRTAMVEAVAACGVDHAIAAIAKARSNKLQGRGERTGSVITAPGSPFGLPFR